VSDLEADEAVLRERREAFVRATVVWTHRPVSAAPGDKAVVTADGRLRGWVGGSCAEPIVVREARRALDAGTPRLLRLGPGEPSSEGDGVVTASVNCASEGSLHVFLEPVLPPLHLVVIGRSPLTRALVGMAAVLGWHTVVVEREDDDVSDLSAAGVSVVTELDLAKADVNGSSFVVVATMGRYDEDALEAALATDARHVALVASRRRAEVVLDSLRSSKVADDRLARVKSPAGLALGDLSHEETAVAILAEIVQLRHARQSPGAAGSVPERPPTETPVEAVDPVCAMTVTIGATSVRLDHDGNSYWFCGTGCRRRFEGDPDRWLASP